MAAEHLSYSGINRSITDYAGSRACEELINLRPTSEGLIPVRPFSVKYASSSYSKVFVHHTTDGDKYIGVRKVPSSYKVIVELIGDTPTTLFERTMTGSVTYEKTHKMDLYVENLFFAAAGNVILFSECAIDQYAPPMENVSFIWKGGSYQEMEANVPEVTLVTDDGAAVVKKSQECAHIVHDSTEQDVVSSVENAMNAVQEIDPGLCLGPIVIATAFKTKDGNTFWTGNWKIYDPLQTIGTTSPPYEDDTTLASADVRDAYDDFMDEHDHGYRITSNAQAIGVTNEINRLEFYGTNVKVTIGALDGNSAHASYPNYWNKDSSVIESVEVYASRPVPYFDTESAYEGFRSVHVGNYYLTILLVQKEYENMELGGKQLYHQASIPMESLLNGSVDVELKFGGNLQVTNETLRVDAGAVTRYGKVLSYNSRFHYYDSVSRTKVGKPSFCGLHQHSFSSSTTYIFVRHSDESGTRLVYMGTTASDEGFDCADLTIAPSVNIAEVILYSKFTRNGAAMYRDAVCQMTASTAYNYSVGNLGDWRSTDGSGTKSEYEALITANKPPVVETAEPAAINVTEQYNPFVFRVEHSYLAPGNVLDVVPQNFVVTDATYGREPLDVFTTQGIYALIQGSGDILYAWFDPVSPMIADGRAVPTEMGIFFLSGGCLYLCAGHRTTLVSDALMAGPHKYVRSAGPNGAYAKIAGSSGLVDMSGDVSAVTFETFAAGGRLSYNRFRQEVYVSNNTYSYSYVLSLKYRQWFKVDENLWQDEPASTIASRWSATSGIDYLDLENEASSGSIKVHLQTRPFSMGYQYAHIHRALSMIRAKLSTGDKAILHLYGSDDLQNWTLLAYASRSGSSSGLYISQLRTPTAARSWRYYTICLTGQVPSAGDFQTDVGPFVVDYSAVIRRLG